jgi:hypothetical protein
LLNSPGVDIFRSRTKRDSWRRSRSGHRERDLQPRRDRFASVAAAIVFRPDFDRERWGSWVAEQDKGDQTVFEQRPPAVPAEQRFENDSYFLCAAMARISLRPATLASKNAQKALQEVLRQR